MDSKSMVSPFKIPYRVLASKETVKEKPRSFVEKASKFIKSLLRHDM
jgi:hypothetical protein